MREAAALPLAGLTAWQALFEVGRLKPGETVIISAGAGGVGHLAVQLATLAGAKRLLQSVQIHFNFSPETQEVARLRRLTLMTQMLCLNI